MEDSNTPLSYEDLNAVPSYVKIPEIYNDVDFELKIENLKLSSDSPSLDMSENPENTVYSVDWRLISSYQDLVDDRRGNCGLPLPDQENFTDYQNLTEEQVTSWIEGSIGIKMIKISACNTLLKHLKQKSTPQINLPW